MTTIKSKKQTNKKLQQKSIQEYVQENILRSSIGGYKGEQIE